MGRSRSLETFARSSCRFLCQTNDDKRNPLMKSHIPTVTLFTIIATLLSSCASVGQTASTHSTPQARCTRLQAAANQQPKPRPVRKYRYQNGQMQRSTQLTHDCFGLTQQEVAATWHSNHQDVATCYQQHVGLSCASRMQIDLRVSLRRNGDVTKASIAKRTFFSATFESCLLERVKRWKFPRLRSKTFSFTYPLLFQ